MKRASKFYMCFFVVLVIICQTSSKICTYSMIVKDSTLVFSLLREGQQEMTLA